jgi:hypothetical protein
MSESGDKPRWTSYEAHYARIDRRRDRIVAEIERNRRGENKFPTWVLALILVLLVGGIASLIVLS